jgi:hypothetical protein
MNVSKLIDELQQIKDREGDIPVYVSGFDTLRGKWYGDEITKSSIMVYSPKPGEPHHDKTRVALIMTDQAGLFLSYPDAAELIKKV